jgi:hypothetical protein
MLGDVLLLAETSESGTYLVAPGAELFLWTLFALAILASGVVLAFKGRWFWLAVGLIPFAAVVWPIIAFQAAEPNSIWSRIGARRRSAQASSPS